MEVARTRFISVARKLLCVCVWRGGGGGISPLAPMVPTPMLLSLVSHLPRPGTASSKVAQLKKMEAAKPQSGESSSTQPTSLLTAPSKVFTPNSVADEDEGYPPEVTPNDDSALDSETPPPEADRTSPEPSHVSSPSNAASFILGLKDRFQKLKETLKLTPDQDREFQECINAVGELEAQGGDRQSSSSESDRDEPDERQHRLTDREQMGSNSSVVTFEGSETGFGEMETEEHSHEEARPFPSTEEVKTAQECSKESMKKIVPDIYYMHKSKNQKQLSDAAFLFLMVVEAKRR